MEDGITWEAREVVEDSAQRAVRESAERAVRNANKVWKGTEIIDGEVVFVDAGTFGADVAQDILAENGWTDFQFIKNSSDNGIDIIARGPQGQPGFFEVKTSTTGNIPHLSARQENMNFL